MGEISEHRQYCIEMIKHPLNRGFFENVVRMLRPGGTYGAPAWCEVFTREELVGILEGVKEDEWQDSREPER